jgi:hypothetical protein
LQFYCSRKGGFAIARRSHCPRTSSWIASTCSLDPEKCRWIDNERGNNWIVSRICPFWGRPARSLLHIRCPKAQRRQRSRNRSSGGVRKRKSLDHRNCYSSTCVESWLIFKDAGVCWGFHHVKNPGMFAEKVNSSALQREINRTPHFSGMFYTAVSWK